MFQYLIFCFVVKTYKFFLVKLIISKKVLCILQKLARYLKKKELEAPGIDPGTSHMLSERSTI